MSQSNIISIARSMKIFEEVFGKPMVEGGDLSSLETYQKLPLAELLALFKAHITKALALKKDKAPRSAVLLNGTKVHCYILLLAMSTVVATESMTKWCTCGNTTVTFGRTEVIELDEATGKSGLSSSDKQKRRSVRLPKKAEV